MGQEKKSIWVTAELYIMYTGRYMKFWLNNFKSHPITFPVELWKDDKWKSFLHLVLGTPLVLLMYFLHFMSIAVDSELLVSHSHGHPVFPMPTNILFRWNLIYDNLQCKVYSVQYLYTSTCWFSSLLPFFRNRKIITNFANICYYYFYFNLETITLKNYF